MPPQCPECAAVVEVDELDVDRGEIISCPECGADLRVVAVSPLEFVGLPLASGHRRVTSKDV